MIPSPRKAVAAVTIALVASACSDEPRLVDPEVDPSRSVLTEVVQVQPEGRVIGQRPGSVVEVETAVIGSFRPNEPLTITGTVSPNMPASDLQMRIWSPQVEFARRSGFGNDYRIQKEGTIPPLTDRAVSGELAEDDYQVLATLSVPAAGMYEIIVSAQATPGVFDFGTNTVVHHSVWILVEAEGGRVLPAFDPALVPEGLVKEPGPFREYPGMRGQGASSLALSGGQDQVSAYVYYVDQDNSQTVPIKDAEVWIYSDPGGDTWAHTDGSGMVTFSCYPPAEIDLRVFLNGSEILISNKYWESLDVLCFDPGTTYNFNVGSAGEVYLNLENEIVPAAETLFSDGRSKLDVAIDHQADNSSYSPSQDEVTINDDGIWGPWGLFVQAHEYGHAYHEKGLGGNEGSGQCNGPHTFVQKQNYQCAFSEGFADFVGMALDYVYFRTDSDLRDRACLVYDFNTSTCTTWGSYGVDIMKTEGGVMLFLNDVVDSSNSESKSGVNYDQVTVSGTHVADIYETCQIEYGSWKRPDRIYWLIHCVQKAIDGYDGGFPASSAATDYSVSAGHSPDFDDVRQLWRTHLFDQTALYDPLTVHITGPSMVPEWSECPWQAWADGGQPPYSYSWSGVLTGSGQTIWGVVGSDGFLNVTVTDDASSQDGSSFYVNVDEDAEECPL